MRQSYRLIRPSDGQVVAGEIQRIQGVLNSGKGLLGKSELREGHGIHLLKCNSIHTFFMGFDIDVIVLDHSNVVLKTVERLKPYRIVIGGRGGKSIVELPSGTVSRGGIKVGEQLEFVLNFSKR